jgi:hypothetical protein
MKTANAIAKINFKQTKAAYVTIGVCFLSTIVNIVVNKIVDGYIYGVHDGATPEYMPFGNYMYMLPLLMGIFVPALNFTRLMNLGSKRMDFFKGSLPTYMAASAFAALFGVLSYYTLDYTLDRHLLGEPIDTMNLLDVFGFIQHGPVVAFLQMLAFLLLLSATAHTLMLSQSHWYGWVADVLIVAVIGVFTPIAPLRAALVWFFNMIIFNNVAVVQIASCLILGAAIYALSLFPIRGKQV